ncbi:hypothetical protein DL765_000197 [Monosporascus sp. GIB2]|nr:hypothetical protein DL765_000197 [Monosporascus sp. GIB2]
MAEAALSQVTVPLARRPYAGFCLVKEEPRQPGRQSTDNGNVPSPKWNFSDSEARILRWGWVRESLVTDLPSSHDIAGAQQHLLRGRMGICIQQHRADLGGQRSGQYDAATIRISDIWYFPEGVTHTIQGLEDEKEYLLVFDSGNSESTGTTFSVDDWIMHTPKSTMAENFGLPEVSAWVPSPNPYTASGTVDDTRRTVAGGNGRLTETPRSCTTWGINPGGRARRPRHTARRRQHHVPRGQDDNRDGRHVAAGEHCHHEWVQLPPGLVATANPTLTRYARGHQDTTSRNVSEDEDLV